MTIVRGGRHRNSRVASFLRASILPAYHRTQSLPCEAYGPGPGQQELSVPFSLNLKEFVALLPFLASMAALMMVLMSWMRFLVAVSMILMTMIAALMVVLIVSIA